MGAGEGVALLPTHPPVNTGEGGPSPLINTPGAGSHEFFEKPVFIT